MAATFTAQRVDDMNATSEHMIPLTVQALELHNLQADQSTEFNGPRPYVHHLDALLGMPIDVVLEIFRHLHPEDLLNLSRTTKDIRSLVLRSSQKWLWETARHNLPGFPPTPSHLSEPTYISLMFDRYCQVCLSSSVQYYSIVLGIQTCKDCGRTILSTKEALLSRAGEKVKLARTTSAHTSQLEKSWDELVFSLPSLFDGSGSYRSSRTSIRLGGRSYQHSTIGSTLYPTEECLSLFLDYLFLAVEGTSAADREEFKQRHKALLEVRLQESNRCTQWLDEQRLRRRLREKALRERETQEMKEMRSKIACHAWLRGLPSMADSSV